MFLNWFLFKILLEVQASALRNAFLFGSSNVERGPMDLDFSSLWAGQAKYSPSSAGRSDFELGRLGLLVK